jgi:hypothetical protein
MGRLVSVIILLLAVYVGGYAGFRQTRQEVKDQKTYVVFPSGTVGQLLSYAWRPLSRADKSLTGMRYHVGPLG